MYSFVPASDKNGQLRIAESGGGLLQLTVMNSRRLTQKGGAKLESIGKPTGILQSLGPYITGAAMHGRLKMAP